MRLFQHGITLLLSLLIMSPLAFASPADDDAGLEDNMTYHLYDDIDLVSTLKFDYGKPRIVIKSVYPQLASETPHDSVSVFNDLAKQIVNEGINNYRDQVKANAAVQKRLAKDKISNNFYVDYNTAFLRVKKQRILSVRMSFQGYVAGMAHDFHRHVAFNFDLTDNHQLTLSELFLPDSDYLNTIAELARDQLLHRLKDKKLVMQGTEPTAENFAVWNLKPSGILFTFDEYQVAPYVYGAQTVLIPYTAIANILAPESNLSYCIEHSARCNNNSVLTGGFIDEA